MSALDITGAVVATLASIVNLMVLIQSARERDYRFVTVTLFLELIAVAWATYCIARLCGAQV